MLVTRIEAGVRLKAGVEQTIDFRALAEVAATIRCGDKLLAEGAFLWDFRPDFVARLYDPVEVDASNVDAVLTLPDGQEAPPVVAWLVGADDSRVEIKDWRIEPPPKWIADEAVGHE